MRHLRKLYEWWPLWVIPLVVTIAVWLPPADADQTVGPTNSVICNKQAQFTGTGATASIATGVAGQNIYICGWHVTVTTGTGTFQVSVGTGSTCTSGTNITPVFSVNTAAPSADHITAAWFSSTSGQTLCVNATVTTVVGQIFYSQF